MAITPLAVLAAIASADAGHGDFLLAKVFFPYSMLLTRMTADMINYPSIGLALLQFPLYGFASTRFNAAKTAITLLVLHTIFALLCFSGLLPNFE